MDTIAPSALYCDTLMWLKAASTPFPFPKAVGLHGFLKGVAQPLTATICSHRQPSRAFETPGLLGTHSAEQLTSCSSWSSLARSLCRTLFQLRDKQVLMHNMSHLLGVFPLQMQRLGGGMPTPSPLHGQLLKTPRSVLQSSAVHAGLVCHSVRAETWVAKCLKPFRHSDAPKTSFLKPFARPAAALLQVSLIHSFRSSSC